jgi:hypothetical protein
MAEDALRGGVREGGALGEGPCIARRRRGGEDCTDAEIHLKAYRELGIILLSCLHFIKAIENSTLVV